MGIDVQVIDTAGVKRARPTDKPVDCIAFGEKKLGKETAILPSDTSDKSFAHSALFWLCRYAYTCIRHL